MVLPRALHDELLAHAHAEAPNECCGMVGHRDGRAEEAVRVGNDAASPLRFEMNSKEQLHAWTRLEDAGLEVAIYHSHTRSPPYPSQTDVNFARNWPGVLHLIVGVKGEDAIRGYWIDAEDRITEAELAVE